MNERLNLRWAAAIVGECVREVGRPFFVAPGSRCTPLTLAIASCVNCHVVHHFDERGLAFACQGFGRAANRPGVFVCTSGTAVANALPAVVEASQENVPMLLLTADRPPELRDRGANQTIDQCHLFGRYVRWFYDLPCPSEQLPADFAVEIIRYALERAADGPVHINCMFREPFGVTDEAVNQPIDSFAEDSDNGVPAAREKYHVPAGNALVVIGGCRPDEAAAAVEFSRQIGAPVLADIASSVRGLAYDIALYRDGLPIPDNVIHFGGRLVSKRLLRFLRDHPPTNFWHVWPYGQRIDPTGRVTRRIRTDIGQFRDNAMLDGSSAADFLDHWKSHSQSATRAALAVIDSMSHPTEPGITRAVAELIPAGSAIFLGNSIPVRAMDSFGFWPRQKDIWVGVNRGASGIDGVLASAIGFARGTGRCTTLIIGDLSLLHDLNSLAMLSQADPPLVVVVVNNDGGGIFHFLPIAHQTRHFERFFATPHGRTFEHAAAMFGIEYRCCSAISEFRAAYDYSSRDAVGPKRSTLIEVTASRAELVRIYGEIEQAVRTASL